MTTSGMITGVDSLEDRLRLIEARSEDLKPFWPEVGRWWAAREKKIFDTKGRGRWAALRLSTILRRRSDGIQSADPLIRTGALLAGVSKPAPAKEAAHFAVFGALQDPSGGMFQAAGKHAPKRSPVPNLLPGERRELVTMLSEYLLSRKATK